MPAQRSGTLEVVVLHHERGALAGATVTLRRVDFPSGHGVRASFDEDTSRYLVSGVGEGRHLLRVGHPDTNADEREIEVDPAGSTEVFVLGEPGLPHFRRGRVRVPFRPREDLVGVVFRASLPRSAADAAVGSLSDLGLVELDVPEHVRRQHVRVLRTTRKDGLDAIVRSLQARPDVERAGPVVLLDDRSVSFLTDELIVRFADAVTEDRAAELLAARELRVLRRLPYAGNSYHVTRPGPPSYSLLDVAAALNESAEVVWAEPNLAGAVEPDVITPPDLLWGGLWDRRLVGADQAWQELRDAGEPAFGSPDVVIAVVDSGIGSSGGVPAHPEFRGTVSSGAPKVARLFDFRQLVEGNDQTQDGHGVSVAGIAAATAGNLVAPGATVAEGLTGAAPNCRVMGLIHGATEADVADMYVWAAGFDPASPRPGFPAPPGSGADVFTTSVGFGAGAPLSGTAQAMLDHLATAGRGGRGCLCFFSAGNSGADVVTLRPYAGYARSFGTAATTLAADGVTEIRAPYSNHGTVELSAPSHDGDVAGLPLHDPPLHHASWSCTPPGEGNLLGHVVVTDTLTRPAARGDTTIALGSGAGLVTGDRLLLGDPGAAGGETVRVGGLPVAGVVRVGALRHPHPAGTTVRSGPADYRNDFGGTSAAAPLAAGVAALLLSADPDLTEAQVRTILRRTAVRPEPGNADPVGRWLDDTGTPSSVSGRPPSFSRWFGHGRVDAAAAVREALAHAAHVRQRRLPVG
ncbi:S8 family serine peptidase [Actinoplanes sp. URMC 104]|uniref:S8 family serine peptidase n=1 Tax=Actinoplanes sp. URMC 104 TaxID=3423409 RepID=UPI003F1C178D